MVFHCPRNKSGLWSFSEKVLLGGKIQVVRVRNSQIIYNMAPIGLSETGYKMLNSFNFHRLQGKPIYHLRACGGETMQKDCASGLKGNAKSWCCKGAENFLIQDPYVVSTKLLSIGQSWLGSTTFCPPPNPTERCCFCALLGGGAFLGGLEQKLLLLPAQNGCSFDCIPKNFNFGDSPSVLVVLLQSCVRSRLITKKTQRFPSGSPCSWISLGIWASF